MLENKYGRFNESGTEFEITNAYTPRPWINVISNGDYSIIVTQTGGGYSFRGNAETEQADAQLSGYRKGQLGQVLLHTRPRQQGCLERRALPHTEGGGELYRNPRPRLQRTQAHDLRRKI